MVCYLLEGDSKEVANIIQDQRIRIDRGMVRFIPCQSDAREILEACGDSKSILVDDVKDAPKRTPKRIKNT